MTLHSRHRELSKENVARYINHLRFNIQDEVGMLKISSIEDANQYAFSTKENLKRKNQGSSWGKEKWDYSAKAKSVEVEPKPLDQR